jgi:hypothetical protein
MTASFITSARSRLEVVHLHDLGWPEVDFQLHVTDQFRTGDVDELRTLLAAWHRVGVNGGYRTLADERIGFGGKGITHGIDDQPSLVCVEDDRVVRWAVDFGSTTRAALDVLLSAVEGWANRPAEGVELPVATRIVVGLRPDSLDPVVG